MVEPQSWQVQQLTSLHCAAQGLRLAVTRVLRQVWSQGVQGDPGHLGHSKCRREQAPRSKPSSSVLLKVNTMDPSFAQYYKA